MPFAISDTLGLAIISAVNAVVIAVLGLVTLVIKEHFDRQRAKEQKEAAIQVKQTLKETTETTNTALAGLAETGNATHVLVNAAMTEQKRLLAVTSRAKADITHDPSDIAAAEAAEAAYRENMAKQASLDAKEAKGT